VHVHVHVCVHVCMCMCVHMCKISILLGRACVRAHVQMRSIDRSRLVVSREAAATLVAELHHAHHVAQQRGAAAALISCQAVRSLDGDAEQACWLHA
jgi:hypothetical protein